MFLCDSQDVSMHFIGDCLEYCASLLSNSIANSAA